QTFLDQTYARGARNYWGTQNHATLTDGAIEALVDGARSLSSSESDVLIAALGGAIDDVAPVATAIRTEASASSRPTAPAGATRQRTMR
ncbi:MAG: hypothetical protein HC871_03210, partial [Rhizobiales bacterium]|nr:hypothetical protein [Hyphomicrobiales bacterium]